MSLNKKERLAKIRADEAEEKVAENKKLNPAFPYRMAAFPYDFFGIENLIAIEEEKPSS